MQLPIWKLSWSLMIGGTWGRISNIPVLQETLSRLWEAIPAERLDSLIRTMLERLQAVINAKGGATRY